MNDRTRHLREMSLEAEPSISSERAELLTRFYQAELGKHSVPVMRALAFRISAGTRRSIWGRPSSSSAKGGRSRRPYRPIRSSPATASRTYGFWIRDPRRATASPRSVSRPTRTK